MSHPEPRNPFYLLLMLVCALFVVTCLAYAFVPFLEEKAAEAGNPPPPSAFRDSLRSDGWIWLLWQLPFIVLFGILSMVLDRLRRLKKERDAATILSTPKPPLSG